MAYMVAISTQNIFGSILTFAQNSNDGFRSRFEERILGHVGIGSVDNSCLFFEIPEKGCALWTGET